MNKDLKKELELALLNQSFISLLEKEEESDSGKSFKPNQICSSRALDSIALNKILVRMKKLSNEILLKSEL
jgi:hypothetical protein